MKKICQIFLFIFLNVVFFGCSNIEKQIIGKWQVEYVEIKGLEVIAKELAKSYQVSEDDYDIFIKQTVSDLEANYKNQILKTVIEFKEDYKFDPDCNKPDDVAEWSYDDNEKRVIIKYSNTDIYYYIEKISNNKMKAKMTSKSNAMEFILELVKI